MGVRNDVIRLSAFLFLLFTPFSSYMTILTHIYEDAGLPGIGPATLACNYTAFILSAIIAPTLNFSLKAQLLFSGVCYTINYSSGIFASLTDLAWLKFLISCTGALVGGIAGGPLWVSQGRYIHLVCVREKEEKREGQMFGLFGGLFCLNNISAGFITTFGLGFFNSMVYFVIITILGGLSVAFCLFFLRPIDAPKTGQTESLLQTQHMGSIETASAVPALSLREMMLRVLSFFPKMKILFIVLIIDGMGFGIYTSEITHLIFPEPNASKEQINKLAGYLMITLGIGASFGNIIFGKIVDRMGTLFSGRLGFGLGVVGSGLFILTLQVKAYGLAVCTAFTWGLFLFYLQSWLLLVCGRHFGGLPEAFAFKQLYAIFFLIFQLSLIPSGNHISLLPVMLGLIAFLLPTIWLIGWVPVDYLDPSRTLRDQKS